MLESWLSFWMASLIPEADAPRFRRSLDMFERVHGGAITACGSARTERVGSSTAAAPSSHSTWTADDREGVDHPRSTAARIAVTKDCGRPPHWRMADPAGSHRRSHSVPGLERTMGLSCPK